MPSDEQIKARVAARCAALGKSLRGVLSEAGLSHETLEKPPTAGRRLDTLQKLAHALNWSLADLLGFTRIEPALLHAALQIVRRALKHIPEDDAAFSEAAARIYNILADTYPDPRQPPPAAAIASIARVISEDWQRDQQR
jgi:hypothetical protein